jgi:hypothetical protein
MRYQQSVLGLLLMVFICSRKAGIRDNECGSGPQLHVFERVFTEDSERRDPPMRTKNLRDNHWRGNRDNHWRNNHWR